MRTVRDLMWGVALLVAVVAAIIVVPPVLLAVLFGPPLLLGWAVIKLTGVPALAGIAVVPAWIGWAAILMRLQSPRRIPNRVASRF